MMSTCYGGSYVLWQLQPYWVYYGPHGVDNANLCMCSTVGYSLFSACAACQGFGTNWITWSQLVTNCTKTLPPSSFPNPVPSQIRVPQWALLDVTNENLWNANKSYSVGDSPELGPGAVLGPSGVPSSTSPTRSPEPPPPGSHNSNTGAVAGGVVGGVAAISIAVAIIFYRRRRRRSRAPSAVAPGVGASQPPIDSPMKLYDPNDPTTFPGYQGALQSLATLQEPVPSHNGTGSTLANMQTSRPQGYHGFPVPTA